jgi:bifunctional non-homologous end joining protein LigD
VNVAGVTISNAQRVVFPESGATKGEVAQHYAKVAARMLPHVAGRPLAVVRCPEGTAAECFFQKHWTGQLPDALSSVDIRQSDGRTRPYVVVEDAAGLVTLAQWGVIEVHPWGSRAEDPDRPDRIIFDVDPGPGVGWPQIRQAALDLRTLLKSLGLVPYLKTSGGKGLHVVVPIERRATWEVASAFSRAVAEHLSAAKPDRYLAKAAKAARKGRVFIDWLRNSRGATAVAPWSLRSRPSAGVSVPVSWGAIASLTAGDQYRLGQLPRGDAWRTMPDGARRITVAMARKLERLKD